MSVSGQLDLIYRRSNRSSSRKNRTMFRDGGKTSLHGSWILNQVKTEVSVVKKQTKDNCWKSCVLRLLTYRMYAGDESPFWGSGTPFLRKKDSRRGWDLKWCHLFRFRYVRYLMKILIQTPNIFYYSLVMGIAVQQNKILKGGGDLVVGCTASHKSRWDHLPEIFWWLKNCL